MNPRNFTNSEVKKVSRIVKEHHGLLKMKQRIKALTGRMCWLDWKINGCGHHMAGVVKVIEKKEFAFLLNSGMLTKIKYKTVTNIELIK